MNKNKDALHEILEKKAAGYLNTPFKLVSYGDDPDFKDKYAAHGTILRRGTTVNVAVTFTKADFEPTYWRITDDRIAMPSHRLGVITLGKDVCVTDPCYDRSVWCMTQLHNVKPGLWCVRASIDEIDSWGKRLYVLELAHRDSTSQEDGFMWKEHSELGVDSGMMSVIDDVYYRRKNGSAEEFEADETAKDRFSDECSSLTYGFVGNRHTRYAGIYRAGNKAVGVICSSGCGDGAYPLDVVEADGEIVAMRINFM